MDGCDRMSKHGVVSELPGKTKSFDGEESLW